MAGPRPNVELAGVDAGNRQFARNVSLASVTSNERKNMTHRSSARQFIWATCFGLCAAACSTTKPSPTINDGGAIDSSSTGGNGLGGRTGTGGSTGSGGRVALDGAVASGGSTGSGGKAVLDGAVASGGSTGSGGTTASGGSTGSGGSTASGGATGSGGSTGSGDEFGFTYRVPPTADSSCGGETTDWLCTFHEASAAGYVYVQSTATGTCAMAVYPTFKIDSAQLSVGGQISSLANARYDWGGNHHNDSMQFDYQVKTYKYYHSSFGFGWRRCQPMDCINVYPVGSTTLETEGCGSTRTLPEVCVAIKTNKTHDPLVDHFQKCPGDAN